MVEDVKSNVATPEKLGSYLINKRVVVKPIVREGKWGSVSDSETNRRDAFLYNTTKQGYSLPYNDMGRLHNVFKNDVRKKTLEFPNEELTEQEFFERILDFEPGSLSTTNKKSWFKTKEANVQLTKTGALIDLSNPMDYLRWLILKNNTNFISSNWEDRFKKPGYVFALVDEDEVVSSEKEKGDLEDKAIQAYFEIKNHKDKLVDFLRLYGKSVADNSTIEFLSTEVRKIATTTPQKFLDVWVNDGAKEDKLLIKDALNAGALISPYRGAFELPGGQSLGGELDTIRFLNDPVNRQIKETLKNRIAASKGTIIKT